MESKFEAAVVLSTSLTYFAALLLLLYSGFQFDRAALIAMLICFAGVAGLLLIAVVVAAVTTLFREDD